MARPKLVSPDQPLPLRIVLGIYQFAASLRLAVVLILSSALTLGVGTFVEAAYGTPAAQFFVYQTWWFNLLCLMLAVNIFSAASIRFPWKRHQTGFVITHIGLLTLLFGALMGRLHGIDAQIPIYEGNMGRWAYDTDQLHFDLTIHPAAGSLSRSQSGGEPIEVRSVPFPAGPFNWPDYETMFQFRHPDDGYRDGWDALPWRMFRWGCGKLFAVARRAQPEQVLYERDGIKLEVLDFYSDSREIAAPSLKFMLSMPQDKRPGPDGRLRERPPMWMPVSLSVHRAADQPDYPYGIGDSRRAGGGYFLFTLSGSEAQTRAFLNGQPQGPLGEQGQVVLHADGQTFRFPVDQHLGQGRFPLEGTDLEAEVLAYWPTGKESKDPHDGTLRWVEDEEVAQPLNPTVTVRTYRDGQPQGRLVLFAINPDVNIHDYQHGVYGDYWFDHSGLSREERTQAGIAARIEFLQGHDQKLYYRYWNREEVVFARELPTAGSPQTAVDAFTMPFAQLKLYVDEFIASDEPMRKTLPAPFKRDEPLVRRRAVARVGLTVDDNREEFWLQASMEDRDSESAFTGQRRMVAGDDRLVSLSMPTRAIDIGFRIRLNNFERKLDPGTSQASHYSSWVDFVDADSDRTVRWASLDSLSRRGLTLAAAAGGGESVALHRSAPARLELNGLRSADALALDSQRGYLVWIDGQGQRIQRSRLNGSSGPVETLLDGRADRSQQVKPQSPKGLAIDARGGKLYWSDVMTTSQGQLGRICRADLDGSGSEAVLQVMGRPEALAIDAQAGKIYWTDPRSGALGRANLDGSEPQEKLVDGLTRPTSIALDPDNNRLYWTESSSGYRVIRRARLDGTGQALVLARNSNQQLSGLALDVANDKLYWTEIEEDPEGRIFRHQQGAAPPHKIMRAGLGGSQVELVARRGIDSPGDLLLDAENGALYWTQANSFQRDVWITMNAPVEFSDPKTGRCFRLFQESFGGPWKPGEADYERHVSPTSQKPELFLSVLTVNYDPGRGVRNIGCLLVVLGIATMFYMRAYFFKPRNPSAPAQ